MDHDTDAQAPRQEACTGYSLMPVYTRRLWAHALNPAGQWLELYRPEPGKVTVVRDLLLVSNGQASAGTCYVRVSPLTRAEEWILATVTDLKLGETYHWEMRQELRENEIVWGYAELFPVSSWATGYVFS